MTRVAAEQIDDPMFFSGIEAEVVIVPWRVHSMQRWAKRFIDVAVSTALLTALAPIILVTALMVRVTSRGPVLLSQTRLGLNGTPYQMLKFRSMISALPDGSAGYLGEVTKGDTRLTPIGSFIRAWRLDELPQLLHVITGTMSLVGPRPDIPQNIALYHPAQKLRFAMPPGCTAWTFTRGAFNNEWSMRQDINVDYVRQWSLWLDLKILLGSIDVLISQDGANPETGTAHESKRIELPPNKS